MGNNVLENNNVLKPPSILSVSGVTSPPDTTEQAEFNTNFSAKTFGSFSDPDGIIVSYEAVTINTVGSTVWSGSGLGAYTASGSSNGDSGLLYLRAKDAAGTEVARAVHVYSRDGIDWGELPLGSLVLDDLNLTLNNSADLTDGLLTVDGINQYASIPDNAQYDVGGTDQHFMVQLDFKADALYPTAGTDQYAGLIKKGNDGYNTGWAIFFLSNSTFRCVSNLANSDFTPAGGISINQWYRIRVIWYDFASVGTASVIIRFDSLDGNGNPQNGFPLVYAQDGKTLITNVTNDLVIGYNNAVTSRFFDGQIKNVIINNNYTD